MKKRVWLTVAVLMACTVFLFMKLSTEEKVGYVYKKGKPYLDMTTESPAYNSVYSPIDRQLQLVVADNVYTFIENVPVVQINNELVPLAKKDFFIQNNRAFLSASFLEKHEPSYVKMKASYAILKSSEANESAAQAVSTRQFTREEVMQYMSGLTSPLENAKADTFPSHLPGANRTYRHGFHEGLDWYTYSAGVVVNKETEVYGMGKGKVVRVDHDYKPYKSVEQRNKDLAYCKEVQKTPAYILDRLRGRQVWIQYDNGMQARFAHLNQVDSELSVGDAVTEETLIGYVGNSGTSGEVQKDNTELHLHVDLLINGTLFWKGLSQEDVKHVLISQLNNNE
ncbi:M23 family metallopeptidase [Priestia flexa]|uniref:M23 family metallopeptidase n=1 Tax=Priestia TaxID=2800373 RepID=UPI002ED98661